MYRSHLEFKDFNLYSDLYNVNIQCYLVILDMMTLVRVSRECGYTSC